MIPARVRLAAALRADRRHRADAARRARCRPADLRRLILTETADRRALGAVLRFMAQALQIAGAVAAQSTSLAQLFGAPQMEAGSAIGNVLHLAGLALLMATGCTCW